MILFCLMLSVLWEKSIIPSTDWEAVRLSNKNKRIWGKTGYFLSEVFSAAIGEPVQNEIIVSIKPFLEVVKKEMKVSS